MATLILSTAAALGPLLLLLANFSLCADLESPRYWYRDVVDWSDLQRCGRGWVTALALQLGVFATHAAAAGLVARRAKAALRSAHPAFLVF